MKKKKIIIAVSNLFLPNGLVTSTRNLYDALTEKGYDVEYFLMYSASEEFKEKYKIFQINPWIKLTDDMKDFDTSKRYLKPLRRVISKFGAPFLSLRLKRKFYKLRDNDVVIIGASLESFNYLAKKVNLKRFKKIVQMHMSRSGLTDQDVINLKNALGNCDDATVLSKNDQEIFTHEFSKNFYYIPNIIDLPRLQAIDSLENSRKIVYAGRFSETKQVDHLLKAFIGSKHDGWVLELYGEGETKKALEEKYGGYPEISFRPAVENIESIFSTASLNAISSKIEGLPMTIVEAGQMGVPTIAYDVSPGVRESLGEAGLLVPPGAIEKYSELLSLYMGDSLLRKELSEKAYSYSEQYRADYVVETWEKLFSRL